MKRESSPSASNIETSRHSRSDVANSVGAFPADFLWGAATAGHQIEGNNVSSDYWLLEAVKGTTFRERSGDANNSFDLWGQDLDLAKSIGFNSYRFSIEWARIEPEPGLFSRAMLDHYMRVIDGCHQRGLTPVVTFSHWTVPVWFAARGGWTAPDSPHLFARFCERAAHHLADGIHYAVTLNEANGSLIGHGMAPPQAWAADRPMFAAAAAATNSKNFVSINAVEFAPIMLPNLIKAHGLGTQAIKAARSSLPVGLSLALIDMQGVGPNNLRDAKRAEFYGPWLAAIKNDDFVGVQNYSRIVWDSKGMLPVPEGSRTGGEGWEIYPASLANAARYVHEETGRPILVTEHGLNTEHDDWRADLITASLGELAKVMNAGVPVLGYMHWSLVDNFEWSFGYKPKYGLASVDRRSFVRTAKPSASVLGAIARNNSI